MFWEPVDLLIRREEFLFLALDIDEPRSLCLLHERSPRAWTKWHTMRDPFELEERIICLHTLDIDLIGSLLRIFEIKIVCPLIVEYLARISSGFIHRLGDIYPFFFRELEVDISELWSLMPNTCTVGIRDEVSMVYLMIFLTIFLVIILWKWWDISESDELRAFEFSLDYILALSFEY